jgi:GT2 family glycosyltransferase
MMKQFFTVIIPTLWRSNFTIDLLTSYENCTYVDEILLIDNAVTARPQIDFSVYKKLRFLEQEENIYVNPAWNLGVNEAKNELIAISNDDILYNPRSSF